MDISKNKSRLAYCILFRWCPCSTSFPRSLAVFCLGILCHSEQWSSNNDVKERYAGKHVHMKRHGTVEGNIWVSRLGKRCWFVSCIADNRWRLYDVLFRAQQPPITIILDQYYTYHLASSNMNYSMNELHFCSNFDSCLSCSCKVVDFFNSLCQERCMELNLPWVLIEASQKRWTSEKMNLGQAGSTSYVSMLLCIWYKDLQYGMVYLLYYTILLVVICCSYLILLYIYMLFLLEFIYIWPCLIENHIIPEQVYLCTCILNSASYTGIYTTISMIQMIQYLPDES